MTEMGHYDDRNGNCIIRCAQGPKGKEGAHEDEWMSV